jgi:3-phenylpropionate/trans-cinnamate dioxygenase ferredoxin reductase subunit
MVAKIIIGAGQAGLQTAEALRSEGWEGEIILLGDEPTGPYHRPPLSKEALSEGIDAYASRLVMRAPEAIARKRISLRTGTRVTCIDRAARQVVLADGERLDYDGLCIATGARTRPLPLPGAKAAAGVIGLRTLADARLLDHALAKAAHVAIIGGGFIGLEVAATARKKGKAVTVVEVAPRLMARVVAPVISDTYATLHRLQGVELIFCNGLSAIQYTGSHVSGITLTDGRIISTDLVVYGIGILPNTELAEAAGLAIEGGGILVDSNSRTSDPLIVAAGDCTATRIAAGMPVRRLESVQNAVEQGRSAAASLLGKERPFTATPWFWSNQYDVNLKIAGLSTGYDQVVIRGTLATREFSAFYFKDKMLIAVDSLNRPKDHLAGRKILDRTLPLTPAQAGDENIDLAKL